VNRTTRSSRSLLRVAALFAAVSYIACQAPVEIPPLPGAVAVQPRDASFVRTDVLPVRLGAFEGKPGVLVEHCRGGKRWLEAESGSVRSSSGEFAKSFVFEPENAARGLQLGERRYRGKLRVEARATGGLRVTNLVPLEAYVEGVVAGEVVLWSAKPAELEAQSIAARTYALESLTRRPIDPFLWDDTRDQAYQGIFLPANDGEVKVAAKLARAVEATDGRVLRRAGALYDSRFHASCGGHTATLGDVFPSESVIFAGGVPCAPCRAIGAAESGRGEARGKVAWRAHFDAKRLDQLARELRIGNRMLGFRVARVDAFGRWLAVECRGELGSRTVEWNEIRRLLDAGVLKSGVIRRLSPADGQALTNGVTFEGVGRGHGVGLCQVGSHALAADGMSAEQILGHYYPLARLGSLSTAGREPAE
jgi:stage II sporulation protein D (peptidoglycan lytic transglycosylase)